MTIFGNAWEVDEGGVELLCAKCRTDNSIFEGIKVGNWSGGLDPVKLLVYANERQKTDAEAWIRLIYACRCAQSLLHDTNTYGRAFSLKITTSLKDSVMGGDWLYELERVESVSDKYGDASKAGKCGECGENLGNLTDFYTHCPKCSFPLSEQWNTRISFEGEMELFKKHLKTGNRG
jgi:hypothetical protein